MLSKNPESYLIDTEHAVRHIFTGIDYYEKLLAGVTPPSQAKSINEVKCYMELSKSYFGYSMSEATLCGAVLQIAFMGVFLFSNNKVIPANFSGLIKPENKKAISFCNGRLVHNIPIGLVIYAGRNQFNHWDDESFDYPTTKVFEALLLAHYDNPLFDLAYELGFPARTIKANHLVLNELKWRNYEQYNMDMKSLICTEHR